MSRAAVLVGVGGWVPPRVVTNADLSERLDTSDEWIRSRTGIAERRFVTPGMATSDLAVEAGARALKSAGEAYVDAVVVATQTPDRLCPAIAPAVASRLGLTGVAAHDVGAVCTGFLYGLATGTGMIAAGVAERVLVVGADTFSSILNMRDRTTAVIFGDGAGAVVLRAGEPEEPGAIGPFDLGSDGEQSDLIMVPAGGSRQRCSGVEASEEDYYFAMGGRGTYRNAIHHMTTSARTVLDRAGWEITDVDRFVSHQANLRLLHAVADRLGIAPEARVTNIEWVGNTAAASIPLALADAAADGTLQPNEQVLLTAFGGGLTWGSTVLVWPDLDTPPSSRNAA